MTVFYHSFKHLPGSFTEHHIKTSIIALLTVFVILTVSCEENPTTIGNKLLPPSDFASVFSTDTISVKSYTMYRDSLESDNPSVSYLGSLYDPYFGSTTGEFISQIRLATSWNYDFFIIDSFKLFLRLLEVTGSVDQPIQLVLSEIDQEIYIDSTYYSSQDVPLTGISVTLDLPADLRTDTINSIVMDVPIAFGDYITRDTSMLFHSSSGPDFSSYFKGLYFQLVSSDPVFLSLSLVSSGGAYANYFQLYMHDESGDPMAFIFALDAVTKNASFNRYIHDFSTADPAKKINHVNDTSVLDTVTYAQRMNGVFTKLTFSGLRDIKNNPDFDKIAVNKARLIFPVFYDEDIYRPTTIPSQAYLSYTSTTGYKSVVPDYLVSPSFFDGTPDTVAGVYNFNLAAYVQGYLEDKTNELKPELELYLPATSSNNVILKANNSNPPVKFEFTYTRF